MATREEILKVASTLFSEKGFENTSVDELSKKCGIAKGSFYKYFPSKEDLIFELFLQIPRDLEKILQRLHSVPYDSTFAKLTDFISTVFEMIVFNKKFFTLDVSSLLPILEKYKLEEQITQLNLECYKYLREFFLDLYGEKIEEYSGDLIFLFKGIFIQYAHVWHYQPKTELNKTALFIATVLELIVDGLIENRPEPLVDIDWESITISNSSPLNKGMRLKQLFVEMEKVIQSLKMKATVKDEYLQTLTYLGNECRQSKPKEFLVNALLCYLENLPKLKSHCKELKELLEL